MPIPPDTTRADRLVVRTPNWLGDAVLALPAMAALRRHFAGASLAIATPRGIAPLFREDTDVRPDEIIELPESPRAAVATLAAGRFDLGVLFPNSFRSAWSMRQARIPARWGYARSMRGWLLTKPAVRPAVHGVVHQADYYRALVRGLGIPCDDDPPRITVRGASLETAARVLAERGLPAGRRMIAFAPGAAYGEAKQWPPARVAALIARLVRDRGATCVVVGAQHDQAVARAIESWLFEQARDTAPHVIDLTGRTSLGVLCGVLASSDVLVSNDSGAMHVGSALGVPVVALFGPTDERATRPLGPSTIVSAPAFCRPCLLRDCPIDHRCMKRITIDAVFAAVSHHLAFARTR